MNPLIDPAAGRVVIGHRGAAAEAPENTLPSFRVAIERGAQALELDVRVTADGVPVVIHDATLDRTTDGRGAVGTLRQDEVRRADAGAAFTPDGGQTFPWRGRGVAVPTLAEVLETTAAVPLIVEVKVAAGAEPILALLDRHGARERCLVGAFEAAALRRFRAAGYRTAASRGEVARLVFGAAVGLAPRRAGYDALTVPERHRGIPVVTGRSIRAAARLGCPVHVWTVDDPERARVLWTRGVAGIITNDPRALQRDASSIQISPPSGFTRSNRIQRPSGDQMG